MQMLLVLSGQFILQVQSVLAHREATDQLFDLYPKRHCSWEVLVPQSYIYCRRPVIKFQQLIE